MDAFTTHTGIGVPLRRANVDTDQIIPAVYLKRITRTGFEDALFSAWRKDPAFILNQEPFSSGSVLVAGPDFGLHGVENQAHNPAHGLQGVQFEFILNGHSDLVR